jgi:FAD/FMN-containing dehydrogenase
MSASNPTLGASDEGRIVDEALFATLAEELTPAFAGDLIGPASGGYDEARTVWNAMVDKRPGMIARCTSTQDVVAVVGAARRHGLVPSIRGGG